MKTIELNELIAKLLVLQDKIFGCGNGKNEVGKFINELKQEYEIN